MDQYASHISDNTKDYARDVNIKLVYIPISATVIFQPLDKYIFGILKSHASSRIDDQSFDFQIALTKSEAADLFVELWNNLQIRHILKAWNTALPNEEISSSSSDDEYTQSNDEDLDQDNDEYEHSSEHQSNDDSEYDLVYDYSDDEVGRNHHLRRTRH